VASLENPPMRILLFPAVLAVALSAGCADPAAVQQSNGCPSDIVATAVAPISCGPTGWRNGGVVTNRYGNGPHVELWGPPTTLPTGRD
jgi:hypothetical protein